MKALLEAVAARSDAATVLARLPQDLVRRTGDAGGLDWMPLADNVTFTRILYDTLGPLVADRFFREQLMAAFDGPLLKALVGAGLRLFGLDLNGLVRWVPRGWQLVFRDVGSWAVDAQAAGQIRVLATGLPEVCTRDPVWLRSVAASFSALLDLARTAGTAEVLPRSRWSPDAAIEFRWGDAAAQARPAP